MFYQVEGFCELKLTLSDLPVIATLVHIENSKSSSVSFLDLLFYLNKII